MWDRFDPTGWQPSPTPCATRANCICTCRSCARSSRILTPRGARQTGVVQEIEGKLIERLAARDLETLARKRRKVTNKPAVDKTEEQSRADKIAKARTCIMWDVFV